MWDLETLRYLNNQAYLANLKMINGELVNSTSSPNRDPVFPLSLLAHKLIVGPPSVAALLDAFENADYAAEFLNLIRDLLPAYERDIMSQIGSSERIQRFCHFFNAEYFPLEDYMAMAYEDFELGDFLHHMPVQLMGFSYDDYYQTGDYRDGFILLLALLECPYYDHEERLPLLDKVKQLVGPRLLAMIPDEGWSHEYVAEMFNTSEHPGVAAFANWIWQDTGYMQLDANYTEYGPEMWSTSLVAELTEQWPRVVELQNQMSEAYNWLEEDLAHNYEIILNILNNEVVAPTPIEQMSLPLDEEGQVIKEEVKTHG